VKQHFRNYNYAASDDVVKAESTNHTEYTHISTLSIAHANPLAV